MKLIKWDGKDETGKYTYNEEEIKRWGMMIDTDTGTVYYTSKEEEARQLVWCIGKDLKRHLHHLEQIAAR